MGEGSFSSLKGEAVTGKEPHMRATIDAVNENGSKLDSLHETLIEGINDIKSLITKSQSVEEQKSDAPKVEGRKLNLSKIGVDFGTTYTGVYYRNENGQLVGFTANQNDKPLKPSIVVKFKDEFRYGAEARSLIMNPRTSRKIERTFTGFKMLIGNMSSETMLRARNYDVDGESSPTFVVKAYLKNLLKTVIERSNEKIEKMVVGIPHIWFDAPTSIGAQETLQRILDETRDELNGDIGIIEFQSEPALACAYFVDRYKNKTKASFNGNVLLVDYGGGTLDINLCQVSQSDVGCEIKVIARTGRGLNEVAEGLIGKAGFAFMDSVIRMSGQGNDLDTVDREYLVKSLEDALMETANIDKLHKLFDAERDFNSIFKRTYGHVFATIEGEDGEISITYDMLVGAYKKEILGTLKDALDEICAEMKNFGINYNSQHSGETFKVVFCGGFCNFCLTQRQIADYFGLSYNDPRTRGMEIDGEALESAIARGAALVAVGAVRICQTFPYALGIANEDHSKSYWAFRVGEEFVCNEPVYVKSSSGTSESVFFGSEIPSLCFNRQATESAVYCEPIEKYINDFKFPNGHYKIGFSLDERLRLTLWLQKMQLTSRSVYSEVDSPMRKTLPSLEEIYGKIISVGAAK